MRRTKIRCGNVVVVNFERSREGHNYNDESLKSILQLEVYIPGNFRVTTLLLFLVDMYRNKKKM